MKLDPENMKILDINKYGLTLTGQYNLHIHNSDVDAKDVMCYEFSRETEPTPEEMTAIGADLGDDLHRLVLKSLKKSLLL
jgi:hypothetical protein